MCYKNPNIVKFNELTSTFKWCRKTKIIIKIYQENSQCHALSEKEISPKQPTVLCLLNSLVVLACFCVHLYVIMLNLIYQWTGLQWNKELIDLLKFFFNCVFLPLFLFSCLYQIILYCKKHHNYNPYIFTLSFEKIFNRCSVNLIHKKLIMKWINMMKIYSCNYL